ncbi:hypothetical protein AB0J42_37740, partial [Nonomuraea sp. NPDC049649]|uniref:hypothetical protein n=1 Tax=Nonomuraea sp. NPDC049649 TaxID=3155776 RepID=UPI00342C6B8D
HSGDVGIKPAPAAAITSDSDESSITKCGWSTKSLRRRDSVERQGLVLDANDPLDAAVSDRSQSGVCLFQESHS